MKNLKVSLKLIVGFLIVILLALFVGGAGILGMSQISAADTELYNSNLIAIRAMGDIQSVVYAIRMHYRNYVIYEGSEPNFISSEAAMKELEARFNENAALYQETIVEESDQIQFDKIKSLFSDVLMKEAIPAIKEAGAVNNVELSKELLAKYATQIDELDAYIEDSMEYNRTFAEEAVASNQALASTMTWIEIGVLLFAVVVAMSLAVYLSRIISRPLVTLTRFMKTAGSTGKITLSEEDQKSIQTYAEVKDEIGECIGSTASFIHHLNVISEELQTLASGDLTAEVEMLSDEDAMGVSLKKVIDNLNNMFSEIHTAAAQVSVGSKHIAEGSQSLAQGSTEQASAIQELSASISEIKDKTMKNADVAREASDLSDIIRNNAQKGSDQMGQMMEAVKEINEASSQISKVIRVIDDIAFQTNILALNAAVEAARAGQHGKGFAVVAEEVRNLAAKSAEAAKDTGGLIENSIEKANFGLNIATETSTSLQEIVEGIVRSAQIVGQIAQASDEQASAIGQINTGIDQVAQVVQQNSATAEESAAASEQMSGQSNMLETLVAQFKLK